MRERDGKKGSKPGRMVRAPEGVHDGTGGEGGTGKRRRGRTRRAWWGGSAASEPETRSVGKWREVLGINGRNPAGHYTLLDTT